MEKVSILDASHFDAQHRLRRRQHAAPRRPAPAHLPHPRRRQDLDGDRHRHSRQRNRQCRPRRSQAQRPAVRRHRARRLCLLRRRRPLAVPAPQYARLPPSATSSSKTTISSSPPTAAASGSSTTSRRCARSTTRRLAGKAYLFEPELAYRVRWDMKTDTPLPPDEPAGQNPPDGAMLDYYLGAGASGDRDARDPRQRRQTRARYSSADPIASRPIPNSPFPLTGCVRRRSSQQPARLPPLPVGPALRACTGHQARVPHRRHLPEHRTGRDLALGDARQVQGRAHSQRPEVHAGSNHPDGSAREDLGRRSRSSNSSCRSRCTRTFLLFSPSTIRSSSFAPR